MLGIEAIAEKARKKMREAEGEHPPIFNATIYSAACASAER